MSNISDEINKPEFENLRRQVAKDCLAELEKPKNKSDKRHTAILDKYTPEFEPINNLPHFPAKRVLGHYVRELQKENKDG